MIQQTSIIAYNDLQPMLGERQAMVLGAIKNLGSPSNAEIASYLGWSINRVTPRVFELRTYHMVINAGERPCSITKRTVNTWKIK